MNRLALRFQELRVALLLLTRLPVGRLSGDMPTIAAARWAYPLAGVLVGGIGWAAFAGAMRLGLDPWIAALLAAGAGVLMTGGLHEDGLADVADGFGGGRDREAKLAIMRDSRIGSYGVLALIFAIGLKTNAMAETGEGLGAAAFVALAVMSRFCMVLALERLAPARADGLGAAASGRGGWRLVTAFLIAAAALVPLGGGGGMAAAVMAVAAGAMVLLAHRQIGGQTGDVLGAVQIVAETAGWLALAAMLGTP